MDELKPPKHKFWGAGEPNCPRDIKAGNGELHTLQCKVCGEKNPPDEFCWNTRTAPDDVVAWTEKERTQDRWGTEGWVKP